MRKIISWCIVFALVLSIAGCGQSNGENIQSDVGNKETAENAGEFLEKDNEQSQEDGSVGNTVQTTQPEISDVELQKLELSLEIQWNNYEEMRRKAESYDKLGKGLTESQMQELIQGEIIKCYEENTLLAVELKTLVMGSVGVDVPSGFATGDAALDSYESYLKDTATGIVTANVEGVISDIAGDDVKDILKDGFTGGIEAYQNNGTLEEVLEGASTSIVDGVSAKVQEGILNEVTNILDETTGGLFSVAQGVQEAGSVTEYLKSAADEKTGGLVGTISGIAGYDSSPGALLQSISNSANSSISEIKDFLNKETITSQDISEMMYSFAEFGNAMETLEAYGATVNFSWDENYRKMEILYKRFVRNEVMIELLSSKGELLSPQVESSMIMELPQTAQITYLSEAPGLTEEQKNLSNYEKYQILCEQKNELDVAYAELENKLANVPNFNAEFYDYRTQVESKNFECAQLLNYSVKNFTPGYDTAGIERMQEFNQMSYAIGEVAKYTPYGIFTNLFTAQAIANTDEYYEAMETVNVNFANAYEQVVLDTRESISELEGRLAFYNELVSEQEDMETQFHNLCLLKYISDDGAIDISDYEEDTKKQLYLLALQIDAVTNVYNALYEDASFTSAYTTQYNEIMAIVDPLRVGVMEDKVSREEMGDALIPILSAGTNGISSMVNVLNSPYDDMFINTHGDYGGRAYFYFSPKDFVITASHPHYSIFYFSDGEPFCVNGYFIYNGKVLVLPKETVSDEAIAEENIADEGASDEFAIDEAALIEHAKWIGENFAGNFNREIEGHIRAMKQAIGD